MSYGAADVLALISVILVSSTRILKVRVVNAMITGSGILVLSISVLATVNV